MNDTLKEIERFHGHLGPFAVIGYKMGLVANEELGNDPFEKEVIVYTGTTPPISCIIDGIQLSTKCTLGKGNIKAIDKQMPKADFYLKQKPDEKITITLKPEIKKEIDTTLSDENIVQYAENIWNKKNEDLFLIS